MPARMTVKSVSSHQQCRHQFLRHSSLSANIVPNGLLCVWNPVTKGTIMSMQGSQGLVGYLTQRSYASKMDESMDACSCTCREFGMGDAVTACILQHKSRALFPVCKTRFSGSDERSSTCQTCPVANMWWSQLSCTVHGQDTNISLEAR